MKARPQRSTHSARRCSRLVRLRMGAQSYCFGFGLRVGFSLAQAVLRSLQAGMLQLVVLCCNRFTKLQHGMAARSLRAVSERTCRRQADMASDEDACPASMKYTVGATPAERNEHGHAQERTGTHRCNESGADATCNRRVARIIKRKLHATAHHMTRTRGMHCIAQLATASGGRPTISSP